MADKAIQSDARQSGVTQKTWANFLKKKGRILIAKTRVLSRKTISANTEKAKKAGKAVGCVNKKGRK